MQIYAAIRQPGNRFLPHGAIQTAALALAILVCALLAPATAQQDSSKIWKYAPRMYQAVLRVTDLAQKQQAEGYEFSQIGCFFGAVLPKSHMVTESFPLKNGVTYVFIASGEDRVNGVDLILMRRDNLKVMQYDMVGKRTAVLVYKCRQAGRYSVVLRLHKTNRVQADNVDSAICSMTVMQKGDPATSCTMPSGLVKSVVARCLSRCSAATLGHPSRFHEGINCWAMVGTVMGKDKAVFQDPKRFEAGRHAFVGASSNESICNYFGLYDTQTKKFMFGSIMDDTDDRPNSPLQSHVFRYITRDQTYILVQGQKFMKGREKPIGQQVSLVVTAILDQPEDDETSDENESKRDTDN